jgi:hypothetical protein
MAWPEAQDGAWAWLGDAQTVLLHPRLGAESRGRVSGQSLGAESRGRAPCLATAHCPAESLDQARNVLKLLGGLEQFLKVHPHFCGVLVQKL